MNQRRKVLAYSFTAVWLLQGFGVALLLQDLPTPGGMVLVLAWGAISLLALGVLGRRLLRYGAIPGKKSYGEAGTV